MSKNTLIDFCIKKPEIDSGYNFIISKPIKEILLLFT